VTALLLCASLVAGRCQAPGVVHVLIVTGLAGESQYAQSFGQMGAILFDAARTRWGVADSSLVYLGENPASDPSRIRGKATREEVGRALAGLAQRAKPNDLVLIVLAGHGSQQGSEPRLSLPGPDLTAGDLAQALIPFAQQTVVVVNTASASGDFLPALSGRRRVVITATKSGFERNATSFGMYFAKGLAEGQADTDKDERVSIAEAYTFARREVVRAFEAANRLLTEHAQLDDDGDRKGSGELGATGDGAFASTVSFGLRIDQRAADPKVAALLGERRRLEAAIAELRARKPQLDSTAYERELERLLLLLAETNQAIRASEPRP